MVIKVGWLLRYLLRSLCWQLDPFQNKFYGWKIQIYARFVPIAYCSLATHRLWKFIAEPLRSFRIWTITYKYMLYHEPRRFAFQCTYKIPFTVRLVTGSISFNAKFTWKNISLYLWLIFSVGWKFFYHSVSLHSNSKIFKCRISAADILRD